MAVYLLHYRELDGRRAYHANKRAALYGFKTLTIDLSEKQWGHYTSIREAMADPDLAGFSWCWLEPTGEGYLDEYDAIDGSAEAALSTILDGMAAGSHTHGGYM